MPVMMAVKRTKPQKKKYFETVEAGEKKKIKEQQYCLHSGSNLEDRKGQG